VKFYTTLVQLDDPHPGLRPGMTAQVEIRVAERDNVLSVPVQAVFRSGGKDHVAVKKPDGGFEWREVTLGLSNGKLVEVKEGLRDGERVSLDPRSLLSEDEPREKLDTPAGRTSQAK
jgi:multidrug efflux pump subunit AcrA (membrane-fusion protein)